MSAAIGSLVDAGLVAGVMLVSALVGGIQRRGTDQALAALLAESAVAARVHRDGTEITVPAGDLVPGDILLWPGGRGTRRLPGAGRRRLWRSTSPR